MKFFTYTFFILICGLGLLNFLDRNPAINLTTKTCVVTGASSGIGRELALQMIKRGWTVIAIARRTHLLQELKQEAGKDTFVQLECDVSDVSQIHTACKKIREQGLQPTLFFLNAGTGKPEYDFDQLIPTNQKTFNTNYFGTLAWVDEWLPFLNTFGGGTFVATLSALAFVAIPGASAYSSSKAATAHCFDSLRRQYLHQEIGFSSVFCGPVDTAMLQGAPQEFPFTHTAAKEATYIINQVFARKKNIYPSWVYAGLFKLLNLLPDWAILKLADIKTARP